MLQAPSEIVKDAARIARMLADQARLSGEADHAAYFGGIAAAADCRADRLLLLERSAAMRIPDPTR